MATKSFDAALNFLPESKAVHKGRGMFGVLKAIVESFEEGRQAEAMYRDLVAHGVKHEDAARRVFANSTKH